MNTKVEEMTAKEQGLPMTHERAAEVLIQMRWNAPNEEQQEALLMGQHALERHIAALASDTGGRGVVGELLAAATDAHDFAMNVARNEGKEADRRFYRLRAAIENAALRAQPDGVSK